MMSKNKDDPVLEVNLISAQNLRPPSKNKSRTQTYAVVWIEPSRKLRTGTDCSGAENPTWNDKFLFRVGPDFIASETSGFNIEIYVVRPFKDSLIGTARCLLSSCLGKFTSVYIHRPSGGFQGILNIAAALCDVETIGADLEIFRGSPSVSFHELTRSPLEKEKDGNHWGRLRAVRSSPSLSTMASPTPSSPTVSSPTKSSTASKEVAKLRPVRSDPSISTMLSAASTNDDHYSASRLRTSTSFSDLSIMSDDIES